MALKYHFNNNYFLNLIKIKKYIYFNKTVKYFDEIFNRVKKHVKFLLKIFKNNLKGFYFTVHFIKRFRNLIKVVYNPSKLRDFLFSKIKITKLIKKVNFMRNQYKNNKNKKKYNISFINKNVI